RSPSRRASGNQAPVVPPGVVVDGCDGWASGATRSPVPAGPVHVTAVPAVMSTADVALNSWVWPSAFTRTLPNRPAGIETDTEATLPTSVERENTLAPC